MSMTVESELKDKAWGPEFVKFSKILREEQSINSRIKPPSKKDDKPTCISLGTIVNGTGLKLATLHYSGMYKGVPNGCVFYDFVANDLKRQFKSAIALRGAMEAFIIYYRAMLQVGEATDKQTKKFNEKNLHDTVGIEVEKLLMHQDEWKAAIKTYIEACRAI
jgi:hypothetical protein